MSRTKYESIVKAKKDNTIVFIVIDRSGSMHSLINDIKQFSIELVRTYISKYKANSLLSVIAFDDKIE